MRPSTASAARSALMAATLLLAGAGVAHADKTLNVVLESEVTTLDPMLNTAYINRTFGYLVYDTLFAQDSKGDVKPQMVDSWHESDDKLTWNFTLRAGQKWTDGGPVTAADCIASLQRWEPRDAIGRLLAVATDSMTADSPTSFTIKLKQPFPLMLAALGKPSSIVPFMMPQRLASVSGKLNEIDGSGPFVFRTDLWRPGDRMVLDRNPAYVARKEPADFLAGGKDVKVDHIVLRVIPDSSTQANALMQGEVDYLQYVPFDFIGQIGKNAKLKLLGLGGIQAFGGNYRVNAASGPFADPAVRRVLWKLVDQQAVLNAIGIPTKYYVPDCKSFWLCGTPLSTDAGASAATYSIADAKAELAKTSYKGDPVVVMETPDSPTQMGASSVLVDGLKKAGFKVDEQAMDWGTLLARRGKKDGWSIFAVWSAGFDLGSPLTHFYVANNCVDYPGWSCDPRITKLMPEFAAAPTLADQRKIAAEIQEAAYDSVPSVMWGQFIDPAAYKVSLKGLIPSNIPVFWNVE